MDLQLGFTLADPKQVFPEWNWTQATAVRVPYPNHWTTREVKGLKVLKQMLKISEKIPDFELLKFQRHIYQIALL